LAKRGTTSKSSLDKLYGGGASGELLNGYRNNDPRVYQWLQRRHKKYNHFIGDDGVYRHGEHSWKVPYGVRVALQMPLNQSQLSHRHAWYATWRSPRSGRRFKKYFGTLIASIHFVASKAQYVDPSASVVSRQGYRIPTALAGKLPAPWKWCPCCMTARKFYRSYPQVQFYAQRKEWSEEKGRYIWKERRVWEIHCRVCGITNRNTKYRHANQPWERVRIKTRRRVRRRRRR